MTTRMFEYPKNLKCRLRETGLGLFFGVAACLILPLARYGHKGLAPLFVVSVLVALAYVIARRNDSIRLGLIDLLFAAFAALIVASAAWSITPVTTLKTAISVVGSLIGSLVLFRAARLLSPAERSIACTILAYGGAAGLAMIAIDSSSQAFADAFLRDRGEYDNAVVLFWNARKPGFTVATLFVWPWLIVAWRHMPRAAVVAVLTAFVLVLAISDANAARGGFLVGLCALAFGMALTRLFGLILAFGLCASTVIVPLVVPLLVSPLSNEARYEHFSESALHRIVIWQNTMNRIVERPILGYGFDSSRSLYRDSEAQWITMLPTTDRKNTIFTEPIPLHPHNLILQLWAETGLIGTLLFAAMSGLATVKIANASIASAHKAGTYATIASGFFMGNINVGAWQAWWLAALLLISTIVIVCLIETQRPAGKPSFDSNLGPKPK